MSSIPVRNTKDLRAQYFLQCDTCLRRFLARSFRLLPHQTYLFAVLAPPSHVSKGPILVRIFLKVHFYSRSLSMGLPLT